LKFGATGGCLKTTYSTASQHICKIGRLQKLQILKNITTGSEGEQGIADSMPGIVK